MLNLILEPVLNSLASSVKKWLKKADFNKDGISDADQLLDAVDHFKDESHKVMSSMRLEDIAKAINLITKALQLIQEATELFKNAVPASQLAEAKEALSPTINVVKGIMIGALTSAKDVKVAELPDNSRVIDVA